MQYTPSQVFLVVEAQGMSHTLEESRVVCEAAKGSPYYDGALPNEGGRR